jgi:hypothetical protein
MSPSFFRIVNSRIVGADPVNTLGWNINEEHFTAPEEYIQNGQFIIYRTVFGVGDWGIILSMPRLLKETYPHCKVYIPSRKLLESTWGYSNRHNNWLNPYDIPTELFKNNPYVDGVTDQWDTEIYHDHFRLTDGSTNDSLVLQMLRFHGVDVNQDTDYLPDLFFSDVEKQEFETIRQSVFGDSPYIAFSARRSLDELSQAHNNVDKATYLLDLVKKLVTDYVGVPTLTFNSTGLDFNLNTKMSAEGVPLRLLLYLICHAESAIGQQTGIYDTCSRYTRVKVVPHSNELAENYLKSVDYIHLEK